MGYDPANQKFTIRCFRYDVEQLDMNYVIEAPNLDMCLRNIGNIGQIAEVKRMPDGKVWLWRRNVGWFEVKVDGHNLEREMPKRKSINWVAAFYHLIMMSLCGYLIYLILANKVMIQ